MSSTLKNWLKKMFPRNFRPYIRAEKWLFKQSNGAVISGPFKGTRYVPDSVGSAFFPKLVGTYEIELEDIVKKLINENFDTLINVGAGEGYFAVGFCKQSSNTKAIAFEADEKGQKLVSEMSKINGIEQRIEVKGFCDILDFQLALKQASGSVLVIMDVEGGEKQLLDPEKVPELREAHILVELHDFAYRDISEIITSRFKRTHEITEIWSETRNIENFPLPLPFLYKTFFRQHFLYFMDEGRPEKMRWYYMKPFKDDSQSENFRR